MSKLALKMTVKCQPCQKEFGDQRAYDQHVNSQGHALRRLAKQFDNDRKLVSKVPKPKPASSSLQLQPGSPESYEPKSKPIHKQNHCAPCRKSFKDQTALNQHLKSSSKHTATILPLRPAQIAPVKTRPQSSSLQRLHRRQPARADSIVSTSAQPHVPYQEKKSSTETSSSWSILLDSQHEALLQELSRHCHSPEDLIKNRYVLSPYSEQDIAGLRKCANCGSVANISQDKPCIFHPGKATGKTPRGYRRFSCCQKANRGCVSGVHSFRAAQNAAKFRTFACSPTASPYTPKSRALVIDCEMARVKGLEGLANDVIQVCAVDYLTGAILLNRLVQPKGYVRVWGTEIHGITAAAMENAILQGQALTGWQAARAELWKLVDQDTILVGHALQHDLDVLRMVHTRVVDSAILARNAVGKSSRQWGLQELCKVLVGVEIRKNVGGVHDCMEDVYATREVVLSCMRNKPRLETWAEEQRQKMIRLEEERAAARLAKAEEEQRMESELEEIREEMRLHCQESSDGDISGHEERLYTRFWMV